MKLQAWEMLKLGEVGGEARRSRQFQVADWLEFCQVRFANLWSCTNVVHSIARDYSTIMEPDVSERPQKLRKLSHDGTFPDYGAALSVPARDSTLEATAAGASDLVETTEAPIETTEEEAANHSNANGQEDTSIAAAVSPPKLSKNKLKKLKRAEEWEANREQRKVKRKEKIAGRRARKRAAKETETPVNGDNATTSPVAVTQPESKRRGRTTLLPITFLFDCGFDDLMSEKERISLASQLTRCYSDNYKGPYKAHIALSSFGGQLKERYDTVLDKHHENWRGVRFLSEDFVEASRQAKEWMKAKYGGKMAGVFAEADTKPEDGEVVYLTSDSPNTLTTLKPYSTYIIGGLVDHNRHKGICYQTAMDKGIKTAKLPIGDYMQMQSRFVLATNHVSEIMVRWLECGDWGQSFMRVMPKRKGGVLKDVKTEQEQELEHDGIEEESDSDDEKVLESGSDDEKVLESGFDVAGQDDEPNGTEERAQLNDANAIVEAGSSQQVADEASRMPVELVDK